ncbi:hypothetical protein SHI21_06000 [Bacteriovorax sp. PP10]|uniref:Uncharacterized protein n=1 Tax=Bacteriovorax antarcticus TaxID=3088717 RepID=A0ABU5VRW5_9BACT|nr:hypothetical protein [Bacteriovorax sp. PP10]MEA9355741.1 hypothetical protein [Bacteriovorax sp. PP10]
MKRYRFLLLAFFLANNVYAEGLASGMAPAMNGSPQLSNVNSTPDLKSNVNSSVPDVRSGNNRVSPTTSSMKAIKSRSARATDIKRTSPRNTAEVGSALEPVVSGSRTPDDQLNNSGNGARSAQTTGTTKTSSKGMSCKTYEGKTYDQGEAGYSDCMRNIRTDRQGTRTVP